MTMGGQSYTNESLLDPENKNKFLYNGKELQDETGWLSYGFREYDPQIGRWHVKDALSEKYYSHSPYAYVMNNPVSSIDILGLNTAAAVHEKINGGTGQYFDISGYFGGGAERLGFNTGPSFEDYNTEINGGWVKNSDIRTFGFGTSSGVDDFLSSGITGFYTSVDGEIRKVHIDGLGTIFSHTYQSAEAMFYMFGGFFSRKGVTWESPLTISENNFVPFDNRDCAAIQRDQMLKANKGPVRPTENLNTRADPNSMFVQIMDGPLGPAEGVASPNFIVKAGLYAISQLQSGNPVQVFIFNGWRKSKNAGGGNHVITLVSYGYDSTKDRYGQEYGFYFRFFDGGTAHPPGYGF